jgi:type VI secretion system protein
LPSERAVSFKARCLVLVLASVLTACGGLFQSSDTARVRFDIAADANANAPVAVDVVAVKDAALLDALLKLPAGQWFAQRSQMRLDYPTGFTSWSWELVPGQTVPETDVSDATGDAYGVLVFASYRTPGDHRARVGALTDVVIALQRDGFVVTASDK